MSSFVVEKIIGEDTYLLGDTYVKWVKELNGRGIPTLITHGF